MAEETLGELYYRLGIKYDELNESFVDIERSLQENLQRINKQKNIIDIQTKIELLGLDKTTQQTEIFEVKSKALQKQIEAQTEKLRLFDRVLTDTRQRTGENSVATQKAVENYERARLAVAKLQTQLKNLTLQQQQAAQKMTAGETVKWQKLFESLGINTKIGDNLGLSVKIGQLKEAFPALSGRIDTFINTLNKIPTPAKAATLAITALPVAIKAAENALLDAAKPATELGDAFYVASRGAQMTIKDFEELMTICKVTGINLDEVTGVMRRLNMQLVKGNDNGSLKQILKQYGVEVRKANGELKNALDMSIALAEGLNRAQAAGRGKDFIAGVFGRGASGDIVTYLEDLAANVEAAKSVVRNGLFDPVRAHNLQGEINKMNAQADNLGESFSAALLPVSEKLVPNITKRMGELTQAIQDNAEGIKAIGESVADVTAAVGELATKTAQLAIKGTAFLGNTLTADTQAVIKNYGRLPSEIKNVNDLVKAEMQKMTAQQRAAIENNPALNEIYQAQSQRLFDNIKKWREENLKSMGDFRRADEAALAAYKNQVQAVQEESEKALNKIKSYSAEIKKLRLDEKFGSGDSYNKSLADLKIWYDEELSQLDGAEKAIEKLKELHAAKHTEIERKLREDIAKINEETANIAFEATHSAFEKQLRDIDLYKKAMLDKAQTAEQAAAIEANAFAKTGAAIQRETDRIKGNFQTLAEKIFAQEHSQRDIDTFRAQKERAEMLQQGNPAELVEHWYSNEIAKINSNRDRNYNRTPKLGRNKPSGGIEILYGNIAQQANLNLPKMDFYGDLQAKVSEQLKSLNIKPLQDFSVAIQPLTREMAALSQQAGSIAQSLSARQQPPQIMQPPNITVSPSININLAGAYVFDNAMRAQLTDDIVTEVTDKIKEAVETAANRQNYSYARY